MVGRSTAHDGAHSDGRWFVVVEADEEAQETCFWGDVGPAAVERESRNGPVEKLFSIFRFGNLPYMVSCFFDTSQPRRHPVTPRRSRHPRSFSLVFVHLGLSDTYDSKKKNAGQDNPSALVVALINSHVVVLQCHLSHRDSDSRVDACPEAMRVLFKHDAVAIFHYTDMDIILPRVIL